MANIVVFASGSGTNFQAIIDAVESGKIAGQIRGLITNKAGIGAIERAKKHSIKYSVLSPANFPDADEFAQVLLQQLEEWETDLIALAGYLVKIPTEIIKRYEGRILNIHPALLPKYGGKGFYGLKVHQAVIENEELESGCSVHVVTDEYDAGPVLAQAKVAVKKTDDASTLAARILEEEHRLYPKVIAKMADKINAKRG
ncbi:MAG TPA: phosphoribosylglycinamide formyltransferase [Balneolaceae bacterium]|nr:phosphoribosylglycinamide formyltransferase [Balneolaceae bacterium]